MRIKHYTLIVAFLAISMGIPLVQGCSDPFDEYGNGGTEMPVRDGWTSQHVCRRTWSSKSPDTLPYTGGGEFHGSGED